MVKLFGVKTMREEMMWVENHGGETFRDEKTMRGENNGIKTNRKENHGGQFSGVNIRSMNSLVVNIRGTSFTLGRTPFCFAPLKFEFSTYVVSNGDSSFLRLNALSCSAINFPAFFLFSQRIFFKARMMYHRPLRFH